MAIMATTPSSSRSFLRFIPAGLWAGILLYLSLMESPPSPPGWLGWDKLQHAGVYGILTWLLGYALVPRAGLRRWVLIVAVAASYGGLMEVFQGLFTIHRDPSWADATANLTGSVLAAGIGLAILRRGDR